MSQLAHLVGDYGYAIVALFVFFEGMMIPFPTDTTLVTASAFAARGGLSVGVVWLVSTIATTLGTTVAFWFGRRGGDVVERHSRRVNPAVLARTRSFFDRHGASAVLIGRFVPFARMLISPLAGLSAMSLARFSVFNLIGAAVWSAVFCGVGYFFGQHPPAFGHALVRATLVVTVALAVLATVIAAGGWLVEESDAAWRAEGTLWHRILESTPMRWLARHSPAAQRFLFRRFSPSGYLGLNLTLGLGLSFVAVILFGAITSALLNRDAVPRFDLELAAALRDAATPGGTAFWSAVSRLARLPALAAAGTALGLVHRLRGRGWLPLIGVIAALAGSQLLDALSKSFLTHRYGAVRGAPSGQALEAVVGYGMLAYLVILLVSRRRAATSVAAGAALVTLAVNFGRLYVGERLFSDIVSGLAAGAVWLSACITGLEVARRRREGGERRTPR